MLPTDRKVTETSLRSIVGALNWLSGATRPDISTMVSLLAQHQHNPSPGHLQAAKYVLRYLKSSRDYGISYSTSASPTPMEAFINFPLSKDFIEGFCDANWGPQDQTVPNPSAPPIEVKTFTPRSISGYIFTFANGLLDWHSGRQTITARSSCESEIYSTDECTKKLMTIELLLQDLNRTDILPNTTKIHNDNSSCVLWSKNTTTKGLRYMTIRENAVPESVRPSLIDVVHIAGKVNPSDMFTKEFKDAQHFLNLRNSCMNPLPHSITTYPLHSKIPTTYTTNAMPTSTPSPEPPTTAAAA